jgi:hypothetical protein
VQQTRELEQINALLQDQQIAISKIQKRLYDRSENHNNVMDTKLKQHEMVDLDEYYSDSEPSFSISLAEQLSPEKLVIEQPKPVISTPIPRPVSQMSSPPPSLSSNHLGDIAVGIRKSERAKAENILSKSSPPQSPNNSVTKDTQKQTPRSLPHTTTTQPITTPWRYSPQSNSPSSNSSTPITPRSHNQQPPTLHINSTPPITPRLNTAKQHSLTPQQGGFMLNVSPAQQPTQPSGDHTKPAKPQPKRQTSTFGDQASPPKIGMAATRVHIYDQITNEKQ